MKKENTKRQSAYVLSPAQLKEIDERLALHDSGKAKYFTADEMRRMVRKNNKGRS